MYSDVIIYWKYAETVRVQQGGNVVVEYWQPAQLAHTWVTRIYPTDSR